MINTNVASLNAQRNLNSSQGSLATSLQRLSSGLRINSAKDDAAGLAISQRMGAQIRALNQSVRNANDGVSMIQTAEGAMNQVQDMLQRMKELGSQAANDTLGANERGFINDELTELRTEINNIAGRTNFNGQYLLNGSTTTTVDPTSTVSQGFSLDADNAITNVDVSNAKAGTTFTLDGTVSGELTLSWTDGASTYSQTLSTAAVSAGASATYDFSQAGVSFTLSSAAAGGGLTAANLEAGLDGGTIVTAAGSSSINLQVGDGTSSANQIAVSFVNIDIENSADASIAALKTALDNYAAGYDGSGATPAGDLARALMDASTNALDAISSNRAQLGAKLNRLDYTVANLQTTSENLAASKSRIQDADFAAETANLTRSQILQQAGTAMLAQANSLPQNVLSLLQG
jgi:flagellin